MFVSERSFPTFAILLGYGMATMSRRLTEQGVPPGDTCWILRRRHLALAVLGASHVALLFDGDVLGIYGMTGLVAGPLLRRRRRTRTVWTALSLALLVALSGSLGVAGILPPTYPPSHYLAAAAERLTFWPVGLVTATLGLIMLGPVLIGARLAEAGLLDHPELHVVLLRRLAVAGLATNLVLNLPYGLAAALWWIPDQPTAYVITALHAASGIPTGLAYLCLFALLAVRLSDRPLGHLPRAIRAVGQRSLTCYLLQSAVLAPAVVAVVLARLGRRGPAEAALRRFSYGTLFRRRPVAPNALSERRV
jgi:uncharacterized protein